MANPYKNKVVYGGTTLIDLTDATATASDILTGKTAYGATGEKLVGTYSGGTGAIGHTTEILPSGGTAHYLTGVDLGDDTVDAAHLAQGYTAHDHAGNAITGACTYDADTSDATATAARIASGYTAYVNGEKVTGTAAAYVSGTTLYIPEGMVIPNA